MTVTSGSAGGGRVRLAPAERREQLLDLGVELLSTRDLDELSIDLLAEKAGISRGLLYHYFGNKQEFHEAVVRRAADGLIAVTAPVAEGDMGTRLLVSLDRYLGFVEENHRGYVSLKRAANGSNSVMREIYEEARAALTDRIFDTAGADGLAEFGVVDSPSVRMMVRGWAVLVEDVVIHWVDDPSGITRDDLLASLAAMLAHVAISAPPVTAAPSPTPEA
ncbi:TetR/AcrR family transcriptional regulator [Nocardioides sp. ChNu-99]|uniref:TetR/AcrR family transcriptional regulator n=1 Tax=Nocardioides sp. ChNu-99 TaxID=2839897 RepID=UPI002406B8FF|nr:TetR/AcrR family transcriptional regulator [Nocardioides sp. ChNu-99]MDF9717790.1 TetR/AcrR family transcriptional regulator [Nocardioides sp. ChNu-99]